jgi:predicted DNA-binding antitoxin AbrB/MazE fold protein
MSETVEAVYEKGVFRPVAPLHGALQDGQRVRLLVEPELAAETALDLALHVFDGLSEAEVDEIEAVIQRRGDYFEPAVR